MINEITNDNKDILSNMKENKQISLSLVGSCVSRDVFGFTKSLYSTENGDKYVIKRYIQSINPVSAITPPVEESFADALITESQVLNASNFYKEMFYA